ncbi:hypothetical protein, conserved [Plasmodium ovale wallikeri]|uniref:Sas10 C-terminal domain-containing protein n=1 Tax=Plasmodium ovale wallikeri TaxID=864142 RepID=A0A1A8Z2A1_PLAOA|nr:hypothetical protein, conserved [Plasmodium ovale wallikeri]
MKKKKSNYLPVDSSKIKFIENSESEDVEIEDNDDSDIQNLNSDDGILSSSNDESIDKSITGLGKGPIRNKKRKKNKSIAPDDADDDDEDGEEDYDEDGEDDGEDDEVVASKKSDNFVKISWKKDKRNYYQNESENSSSDNDEDNDERIKEAIYLNKKEKENLDENDYDLYNIYMKEKGHDTVDKEDMGHNLGVKENVIKRLISDMNDDLSGKKKKEIKSIKSKDKKEIEQIVMSEQEEYKILLKELSLNIQKVFNEINENKKLFEFKEINENNVSPSDINKNTLLYLKKKNETMLTYIIYITYYIFLKIMNCYSHSHPVLEKLIYMNTLISKTNELDNKIKFKIQQLNKSSGRQLGELDSTMRGHKGEPKKAKAGKLGNKEVQKGPVGEVDNDEMDNDDVNDDDVNDDDMDDDDVNDDDMDDDDVNDDEVVKGPKNKSEKYKVSKSIITEYTDSHIREKLKEEKRKKREQLRNERNAFLKEIKDMVSNRPEKIEEQNYLKKMEEKFMNFDEKILNKKMKALSKKKNKMKNLSNVGMTSNDLLKFVELPEMNEENDDSGKNFQEKKMFRNNINKIKQMNKNKLTDNDRNDDFVYFKKFNMNQSKGSMNHEKYDNPNKMMLGKTIRNEIDDENIKRMLNYKNEKKANRKLQLDKKNKEIRKKLVDAENEVNDRRIPNKSIIQNKGLVRKRKSTDGNARVHNKQKFMKKMKVYNSQHAKLKIHDNNYSGEKKGINPYLKKSIDIK